MLRQLHIFYKKEIVFTHTYAMAIGDEELSNVKKVLSSYLEMPMPGKTFQHPGSNFQIFHRSSSNFLFLFITDLIDNKDYIENILIRIIDKFRSLFPELESTEKSTLYNDEIIGFLNQLQHNMHSKIAIMGPFNSGKTFLYNMLKDNEEREIADFAKAAIFNINELSFDLWDFQLAENFHGLWGKFIKGSDLILLLFDVSNYNLKVIEHFLQLHKQESNLSKLLIIGNKVDLVNEEEIKLSKNLLNIGEFKKISLKKSDAKQQILELISLSLGLKKSLPDNFNAIIKEAEKYEIDENYVLAISKYKELINICNKYQDFLYISEFKEKLQNLYNKIENFKKSRRKDESKLKFEIPGQIKFHSKISVSPLPAESKQDLIKPVPPKKIFIEMPLEGKYEKKKVEKLTLFTQEDKEVASKKDFLKFEDINLDLTSKTIEETDLQIEKEFTPSDFPQKLQALIENYGSSLSLKLCEHLINELKTTLARPLTTNDLETAAEIFVNQENF